MAVNFMEEAPDIIKEFLLYMQNIKGYEGNYAIGADGGLPVEIGESIICNIKVCPVWLLMIFGKFSITLFTNFFLISFDLLVNIKFFNKPIPFEL